MTRFLPKIARAMLSTIAVNIVANRAASCVVMGVGDAVPVGVGTPPDSGVLFSAATVVLSVRGQPIQYALTLRHFLR